MKLEQLLNSEKALSEFSSVKLKAAKAFELLQFLKKATEELKNFYEVRNNKIKELGESNDEGQIQVKPENMEQFTKEIFELLQKDVELQVPELTVSDLGDEKLSTETIALLDWLIK